MSTSLKAAAAVLSFAALVAAAPLAQAEMTAAEADRLGKDLTPNGAEKAGNKDGSIPAWDGGLTKPPAGWKPEQGYVDPFANEKPLFVITAQNMEQYKDKLTPGLQSLLKKYPATFKLPVYPSHRSFSYPQAVYDATKAHAPKVKSSGDGIENYNEPGFTPFPMPKNGIEAMFNHKLWWFGGYNRCNDWLPTRASGEYYRVGFCEEFIQGQNFDNKQSNHIFSFYGLYDAPATLLGTIYLVHDPIDYTKGQRQAWIYNAGQRRVRRAPDVAFDNIDDGTEGMRTTDDYWMFNGSFERYNWKLVGKKEMYIPYNAYKINDSRLKYADMMDKGSLKSDLRRYELHRVWVVEATLKPGMSHVYGKRVYYLDEDSYQIALGDIYDTRGSLWRVSEAHLLEAYDTQTMFQSPTVVHDLANGSFIAQALMNERKAPVYAWNAKGKWAAFQMDAIRRKGTR
ncbi:MAG: DUF1329 domain-containing protein [Rhodocyclaceae bacterium]|nr:DUF1329 domain-containing protein [Rhodocyclaceae bacterium]